MIAKQGLVVEADLDIARAANRYRGGASDFCDVMIRFATERSGAEPLYTLDRKAARLWGEVDTRRRVPAGHRPR